uniref:pseudouridine synthase n=1 Tax=uncultured Bilophila sp. TaxID=529385 RepID=UPI0025CCAE50|nr:pseudouridine synthase [uncultured Bilophila sp.]
MTRADVLLHNGKQLLISIDQTFNALTGFVLALLWCLRLWPRRVGLWWADETISAHCWRWHASKVRSWPRAVVDTLLFWDNEHCRESYISEVMRAQSPPETR